MVGHEDGTLEGFQQGGSVNVCVGVVDEHAGLNVPLGVDVQIIAPTFEETTPRICNLAQEKGLLYSVYHCYDAGDTQTITSGEMFRSTERLHPAFTILIYVPGCPDVARKAVYEYVKQARNEQLFRTPPWEAVFDGALVDSIISQDACSAGFDETGQLMTLYEKKQQECLNLFHNDLPRILQLAFPKKNGYNRGVETAGAAIGHSLQ